MREVIKQAYEQTVSTLFPEDPSELELYLFFQDWGNSFGEFGAGDLSSLEGSPLAELANLGLYTE